jgi:hypothetical protein
MGLVSRAADLYYTFRFLKLLVTPWNEMEAYKLGIIGDEGKVLRRASTLKTDQEKSSYTLFHRLVFNIKRLLEKVPGGKSRLVSYAAALYLLKEHTGMSDEGIRAMMNRIEGVDISADLKENRWMLDQSGRLQPGAYILRQDAPLLKNGEFFAKAGTKVDIVESTEPMSKVAGIPVYKAIHRETRQAVVVTKDDLFR